MADGAVAGWLDGFAVPHAAIEAQVAAARDHVAARGSDTAIEDAAARELIEDAALTVALLNAASAIPGSLPLVGPVGTLALSVAGAAGAQLAVEVRLVRALAVHLGVALPDEAAREVILTVVRGGRSTSKRAWALELGGRLVVKKLAEKLLGAGLARAAAAGTYVLTGRRRIDASASASLAGWIAVPLVAVLSWRGTIEVGERALAFCYEAREAAAVTTPPPPPPRRKPRARPAAARS